MLSIACASLAFSAPASKHRAKFEQLIASVTMPHSAIEFVDSEKQRALFKGALAGTEHPEIYDAFAIVYEELGPVRVAGEMIVGQLAKVATSAVEKAAAAGYVEALATLATSRNLFRLIDSDASGSLDHAELMRSPQLLAVIRNEGEEDAAAVERFMRVADEDGDGSISFVEFANAAASELRLQTADDTNVSADAQIAAALASARELFDLLDADGDSSLDRDELTSSPELLALIRQDGEDDAAAAERFFGAADSDSDGSISFVEFANAAATEPRLQMADVALEAALQKARNRPATKRRGRFGRKSPDERFDEMISSCRQWEDDLGCALPEEGGNNDEENRLLQVLKGSFAGARCEPVATALRVCYMEYSPLRMGGDLIFKLLKRVVASQVTKVSAPAA